MRNELNVLWMLLFAVPPAVAQVNVSIGLPSMSIAVNLPMYPELVPVPGYPVYYAPRLDSNFFFYDGMYWVYQDDNWYASSWYNGPWRMAQPYGVPAYVLRVPVRYYRQPPAHFRGWRPSAPPRWNDHWGSEWAQRRSGWDRWDRSKAPVPAPLPAYQRKYSGDRYPGVEQQTGLHDRNYHYLPRDPVVRQQHEAQREQPAQARPAPVPPRQAAPSVPRDRTPGPQTVPRSNRPPPAGTVEKPVPAQSPPQQRITPAKQQGKPGKQDPVPHQQPESRPHNEDAAAPGKAARPEQEHGKDAGREKAHDKADERGQDGRR
jgi:hypothetical protein